MDFFTTVGFIGSTATISDKAKGLSGLLSKVTHYITNGSCELVVFGSGGTGKTTLTHELSGDKLESFEYKETPTIETLNLNGEVWGNYLVAPGQEARVDLYWTKLFDKMTSGAIKGIINVVSYGYHSTDLGDASYKSTKYFDDQSRDGFLEHYLSERRIVEVDLLDKIATSICNTKEDFWMITLVNKQDLWWDVREDVKSHYVDGSYDKIIEKIKIKKGTTNFIHEYASASILNSNFKIGNDLNVKTVEGYDEPLRINNFNKFVELLTSKIKNG